MKESMKGERRREVDDWIKRLEDDGWRRLEQDESIVATDME